MIVALAAIAVTQQGSLFARTFPNPTGGNGWEEYLMAADMMTPEASRVILGAGSTNRLTVARTALKEYGRVCDLIRAGNNKPIQFPWEVDHYYAGHLPAYAALKEAARVLAFEADVAFAEGKPRAADPVHKGRSRVQQKNSGEGNNREPDINRIAGNGDGNT